MTVRLVVERVTPNDDGLYECPTCHSEYATPAAAALCCDETYEPER